MEMADERNTLRELNECELFTIDEEEVSLERESFEEVSFRSERDYPATLYT